jgi:hypothetical protein
MTTRLDEIVLREAQKYKFGRRNEKTLFISIIETVYQEMQIEISEEILKEFGDESYPDLENLQDKLNTEQTDFVEFFAELLEQYICFEEERINQYINKNESWLAVRIQNKIAYFKKHPEAIAKAWEDIQNKHNQERE